MRVSRQLFCMILASLNFGETADFGKKHFGETADFYKINFGEMEIFYIYITNFQ